MSDTVDTTDDLSTNYTRTNNPGAGRLLGNFYSKAGRQLEKGLGKIAVKMGVIENVVSSEDGKEPWTVVSKISRTLQKGSYYGYDDDATILPTELQKQLAELCKKLLGYIQSEKEINQLHALYGMQMICLCCPVLVVLLQKEEAEDILEDVVDKFETESEQPEMDQHPMILEESRKTLSLVRDDSTNVPRIMWGNMTGNYGAVQRKATVEDIDAWKDYFFFVLSYLREPGFAFYCLKYIYQWWSKIKYFPRAQLNLASEIELFTALAAVLDNDNLFKAVDHQNLEYVCRDVHKDLISRMSFLEPFCSGELLEENIEFDGLNFHLPSLIEAMNMLLEKLKDRQLEGYHSYSTKKLKVKRRKATA